MLHLPLHQAMDAHIGGNYTNEPKNDKDRANMTRTVTRQSVKDYNLQTNCEAM